MALRYKIDIMAELKKNGYTSTRIREEKLIGQSYLQQIRHNELVSWKTIDTLCRLLNCQVGDLVEYVAEELFSTFQEEMKGDCGSSRLKGTAGQQTAINRGRPFRELQLLQQFLQYVVANCPNKSDFHSRSRDSWL